MDPELALFDACADVLTFFVEVVVLGPMDPACGAEATLIPASEVGTMLDLQPKGKLKCRCTPYGRSQNSGMGNCLGMGSNGSSV